MEIGAAILGIVLVAVVFGWLVTRLDRVALFAPRSSRRLDGAADHFCVEKCRLSNGTCSLTGEPERAAACPLWRFVSADMPTSVYGSPFAHLSQG